MTRQRKRIFKKRSRPHNRREREPSFPGDRQLAGQVKAQLYLADEPLSINDLVKRIGRSRSDKDAVKAVLGALCSSGGAQQAGVKQFILGKKHQLMEAIVEITPSGYAFATELSRKSATRNLVRDPRIPTARLGGALNGDRVLIELIKVGRDGRSEAEILQVLNRRTSQLAGFFRTGRSSGLVSPEDPRYPFEIKVAKTSSIPVQDGDAVIVRLLDESNQYGQLSGEIIEVLGDPSSVEVQARLVIEKFTLPHVFSPQAEREAQRPPPDPAADFRRDLRNIEHVTIDGSDAKDFDDAIAVQKLRAGFRLFVSIADVSAFVQPGSTLDREAYERGTSVYFPGMVVPMLPENLSNNLCSLRPDADRLAVTAILDFDRHGALLRKEFVRSLIRSRQRFTYETVEQIVVEKNRSVRAQHKPFLTPLKLAAELATALQKMRQARGAIAFTMPEVHITLDAQGNIASLSRAPRLFSHQIIEECMLAANEAVAQHFAEQAKALLYRIHEEPEPDKISDFITFSASLGLQLPKHPGTPGWYNDLIDTVKGTPHEYIVNNLLLRTMQQARYSPKNVGHFGLASAFYTHFTSPIRRYPDLIVHRLLCRMITPDSSADQLSVDTLLENGRHLSERERTAMSCERDMVDRLKRQYMAQHLGDSFSAVISGVADTVFFVELLDIFVSGAVSLNTLSDDYYILDAKRHRLVGDISGRVLQIGNLVEVTLLDVDHSQNRLFFGLKEQL